MEYKAARQRPQDANEAYENDGGLQQIDAQIARSLSKMTRILLQSLIGINANFASLRKTERSPRLQPFADQVTRQPFSQLQLEHLVQPGLRHIQKKDRSGDSKKDQKLMKEGTQIAI
ncbi:hypothetical protein D9M72_633700 [compost metagenome]